MQNKTYQCSGKARSDAAFVLPEVAMSASCCIVRGGGKSLILNDLHSSYGHFNQRKNLLNETKRTPALPVSLSRLCQAVEDIAHTSPVRYMYFLTFHPMSCRRQGSGMTSFLEVRRQETEDRMREATTTVIQACRDVPLARPAV